MAKNPGNIAENVAETAGGAQIPDPSDAPGGVLGRRKDMNKAIVSALKRKSIGKKLY